MIDSALTYVCFVTIYMKSGHTKVIALRLKAAYFIIRICSDDLISLERESVGTGVGD